MPSPHLAWTQHRWGISTATQDPALIPMMWNGSALVPITAEKWDGSDLDGLILKLAEVVPPFVPLIFTDDFNIADTSILDGDLDWAETNGVAWQTVSNEARLFANAVSMARAEHDVTTPDMYVKATLTAIGGSISQVAVCARWSSSADTYYMFQVSNGGAIALRRSVAASRTDLVTGTTTISVPDDILLQVTDEGADVRIRGYVNDVQVLTYLDTSGSKLTTGTRGGIYGYNTTGDGHIRLDDFEVGDIAPPSTFPMTLPFTLA